MRSAMMREARIAGRLEHPSIVPVHALGHDERGQALIVMKKVTGASWHELLQTPGHAGWGEGDPLLRKLEILIAVCRAMELAHARGWIHRDIKTENVMLGELGEFGEVYVLDWGIAARIDRSPRRPPRTLPELQDIVAKAMAYHPADRYPSVAAFRAALGEFVVHRDPLQIADRAEELLARVRVDESEEPRADLFGDALSLWAESERTREGLDRGLDALCERELSPFSSMLLAAGLGLTAAQSMPLDLFLKAGGTVILGLVVLPAFMAGAIIIGLAAGLQVLLPDYPLEIAAVGLSGSFIYLAYGLTRLERSP